MTFGDNDKAIFGAGSDLQYIFMMVLTLLYNRGYSAGNFFINDDGTKYKHYDECGK